ncbi:competence protein CelA [Lactococcus hodotermopsidis]|uniref:Competence protein CelA n=1 Tax=Pseudolactococcus hodotermopsidis TaxID=2709157 RepID=A0A6A0BAL3_9LACT|nr:helix-hairpin-helix domain-containing protein [Lactococcus hodotermopsidis]GFH41685.1 competence protein CelA [Lactococcus hodotermopsidis]
MLEKMKENVKMIGVGLAILLIAAIFVVKTLASHSDDNAIDAQSLMVASTSQSSEEKSEKASTSERLIIDVKGAVNKPSIYEVAKNARVNDVIELAGGLTADADVKSINLAQKLTDEMVVYVATVGEEVSAVATTATDTRTATTNTTKVNLNTADLAQLQTLSGVGAKKAQDIIDYREQNGNFKTVADLGNVSGFGEKTIEKLKESITVD